MAVVVVAVLGGGGDVFFSHLGYLISLVLVIIECCILIKMIEMNGISFEMPEILISFYFSNAAMPMQ